MGTPFQEEYDAMTVPTPAPTASTVQWMPVAASASAVARPMRSTSSAARVAPRPMWWGNSVAPCTLLCPWTASIP